MENRFYGSLSFSLLLLIFAMLGACSTGSNRESAKKLQGADCSIEKGELKLLLLPQKQELLVQPAETLLLSFNDLKNYSFRTKGKANCKGNSLIELSYSREAPKLTMNFFYKGNDSLQNDTDTLSILDLLSFKGKIIQVEEKYFEENRPAKVLGYLKLE